MILLSLICALSSAVSAQTPQFETRFQIFWPENLLIIDVRTPLVEGQILPVRRLQTENHLRQNLPGITFQAVSDIVVDHQGTVRDYALRDPALFNYISGLSERLVLEFSRATSDFQRLEVRYSLPLNLLSSPFLTHDQPWRIKAGVDRWGSNRTFTGLVIHAADPLPVHGEEGRDFLRPSLFPRLLDPQTEVIFSKENLAPDLLRRQPAVLYTTSYAETPHRHRIGSRPLRIAASAVYGRHRNDLLLLEEDAQLLLGTESGRRVLSEGRILIIIREEARP